MSKARRQPDCTRARILEAAQAIFATRGYDRASVAEICRAAGVTKGGFYHHFESKQALFLALLSQWLNNLDERLNALEQRAEGVPQQLVAMTGVIGHILASAKDQLPIYLEFLIQSLRDPALREEIQVPYQGYHRRIADLIQRGIAEGSLQAISPSAVARLILAAVMGFLMQALLAPDAEDWEQATTEGLKVLLKGLKENET